MQTAMKIERNVVIKAEQARVWKAITTPEQMSQWFEKLDFARLAVGEPIDFSWGMKGEIAIVEPIDRFGYRWQLEPPTTTLVIFALESIPEGTRLTVTETGFEALNEPGKHLQQNSGGWDEELGHLVAYVEGQA